MKRFIDILGAVLLLLLLFPLLVALGLLTRWRLGSPVFFCQERVGKDNRIFTLIKFRTLKNLSDSSGNLLPDEQRQSQFGNFMRKSSLDELPEIVNILRGDMSFVGPRPLLVEYLPLYSPHQARRHEVRPGLTGWSAVNGRNNLTWQEKFDLDVWYVDNQSLLLDLKILFMTVATVIGAKNINPDNQNAVRPFDGNIP